MNEISTPAIHTARKPCATSMNISGRTNPNGPVPPTTIGVAMNVAINNPRIIVILTLFVLKKNPKKMKKNNIPQSNVGEIPVAVYPGKRFGIILFNAK
jgi:hypothetical protein